MRYAICYVSTAQKNISAEEIEDLLKYSQNKNNEHDVKGILLYSKENFFQVLEGNKEYLISLFGKIQNDSRHHSIIQVVGKDLDHGSFDGYTFDIVTEKNKYGPHVLQQYLKPLKGMDEKTKEVVKDILEVFIETRV